MRYIRQRRILVLFIGMLYTASVEAAPVALCLCCPPSLSPQVLQGAASEASCCPMEVEGAEVCQEMEGGKQACGVQGQCLEECSHQPFQGILSLVQLPGVLLIGRVEGMTMWRLLPIPPLHAREGRGRKAGALILPELCCLRC